MKRNAELYASLWFCDCFWQEAVKISQIHFCWRQRGRAASSCSTWASKSWIPLCTLESSANCTRTLFSHHHLVLLPIWSPSIVFLLHAEEGTWESLRRKMAIYANVICRLCLWSRVTATAHGHFPCKEMHGGNGKVCSWHKDKMNKARLQLNDLPAYKEGLEYPVWHAGFHHGLRCIVHEWDTTQVFCWIVGCLELLNLNSTCQECLFQCLEDISTGRYSCIYIYLRGAARTGLLVLIATIVGS